MQTFVWDRHFTTGLELVDRQHRYLVDLINRLGESLVDGTKDDNALQEIFTQLSDYARYHFAEEEGLMAEAAVSAEHIDSHRQHHSQFIEEISRMWKSRSAMNNPAETLHGFLAAWLGFHILGEDRAMARQIASIRTGVSPAAAYGLEAAAEDNATHVLLQAVGSLYHILSEQNRELAQANSRLEGRVAARTRELADANRALIDANRKLRSLSRTDGLLGIANRTYFDEKLDEEWRRAGREKKPLALVMIDVDQFKLYNDAYGHQSGDRCLQSVTQAALSALLRPADLLARYGGEEFVMLLPNTEVQGGNIVAHNVCRELERLHIPHGSSTVADHVTVSIGVAARTPGNDARPEQLIAAADRALYIAKERGRNQICCMPG